MRWIGFIAVLAVLFTLAAQAAVAANPVISPRAIVKAINAERSARDLPALRVTAKLRKGARASARLMLRLDTLATPALGKGLSENRFWRNTKRPSAKAVVKSWLRNKSTRANLLSGKVRKVGVGVAFGEFRGNKRSVVIAARFSR